MASAKFSFYRPSSRSKHKSETEAISIFIQVDVEMGSMVTHAT